MFAILITIHVIICLGLILVILMQSAKGEGLAGAFGGTSLSGAVFGGRGAATFLSKATTIIAISFMVSCLVLTFVSPARQATKIKSAIKDQIENAPVPTGQPSTLPGEQKTGPGDIELPPAPTGDNPQPTEGGE
ncbi:MAG: preprotein translocase subunit SecG [candidate division Zixibacteria bacterium]|nr:preprotein translocase subunit SecG [candidate division Zixibacteria bacterium]